MDQKYIGPNINTIPARAVICQRWPIPSRVSNASVIERSLVQFLGLAICRNQGRVRDTEQTCPRPLFIALLCLEFVPFVGDPRERMGYVAIPPTVGPPRRQGIYSHS